MPQEFRGFTDIQVSLPSGIAIENISNMLDSNPNTYARVYTTTNISYYDYYTYRTFFIRLKVPPTLKFYELSLQVMSPIIFSPEFKFRPLILFHTQYPPNTTEGGWDTNIFCSSYTPFRMTGSMSSTSNISNSVFSLTSSTSLTTYKLSVKDMDVAFLGGTNIPSTPQVIPSRYRVLSERGASSSGGTLIIGFEFCVDRYLTISSGTPLFYIYDVHMKIPDDKGDWYYYLPSENTVVSVNDVLKDENLSTYVGGLNRTDKILFCLIPRSGVTVPSLSLHAASETDSNVTIQVYGDTNFDFSGQPMTTFQVTPDGGWVTLNNLTVDYALQFVPEST